MATMKKHYAWLLAATMALLLAGCASQKGPAQQALASADTALAAVRDQAQKYVPDQLQAVESQLQAAKDAFAKGDYKAVIATAPALSSAISSLGSAAAAKANEAEAALAKAKDAWG